MIDINKIAEEYAGCSDKCSKCTLFETPDERMSCCNRLERRAFKEGAKFMKKLIK